MSTYTNILLHIIFSTKERVPLITPDIRGRVHEYLGGAVQGEGGVAYEVGGTADHVHLLVRWIPGDEISDLLREIKSGSSRWVHNNFEQLQHFRWQVGYGAFSVSHSQKEQVAAYIRNQEVHHQKQTYQQEFRHYLHVNEIPYEERYVWE